MIKKERKLRGESGKMKVSRVKRVESESEDKKQENMGSNAN